MIHLSQCAINEVLRLRSKHSQPSALLRIGVQPSCCSSFSYTLGFDDIAQPDDRQFAAKDLNIVVSSQMFDYLNGLSIDYSEDLLGGGFRFHNPNANRTCDCGNSFSLAKEP
jgi:iron-sulfur cluster assembly protein